MKKYRIDVYIVDDHQLLTEGLAEAINRSESVRVSHTFSTLAECRSALQERRPDVLLLDLSMPDGDSMAFSQWVLSEYPKVKIIAVTIHDEYSIIRRTLDAGIHGYVMKSSPVDELIGAIVSVWHDHRYVSPSVETILRYGEAHSVVLTPVEQKILTHLCEGCTNPEMARQLNLSPETVSWYRKRLLAKYGVKNTVSLVTLVMREKILPDTV